MRACAPGRCRARGTGWLVLVTAFTELGYPVVLVYFMDPGLVSCRLRTAFFFFRCLCLEVLWG
jgi:hypothetical protein